MEYAMFNDLFQAYSWVATPYDYDDVANLCASLDSSVIAAAEISIQTRNAR